MSMRMIAGPSCTLPREVGSSSPARSASTSFRSRPSPRTSHRERESIERRLDSFSRGASTVGACAPPFAGLSLWARFFLFLRLRRCEGGTKEAATEAGGRVGERLGLVVGFYGPTADSRGGERGD